MASALPGTTGFLASLDIGENRNGWECCHRDLARLLSRPAPAVIV